MLSKFWVVWFLFLCAQVITSQGSESNSGIGNVTNIYRNPNQGFIIEGSTKVREDEDKIAEGELDNNGFEDVGDENITLSWEDYDGGISLENQSYY